MERTSSIEMQIATIIAIEKRMAYYGCSVYRGQLQKGDNDSELRAVYAICLLDDYIWQTDSVKHHRFQLMDRQTQEQKVHPRMALYSLRHL